MRKSKIVLATLAASVFAVSSGALVACSKDSVPSAGGDAIEVTFDANGGTFTGGAVTTKVAVDADGKIAAAALPTATRAETADTTYTFAAWYNAKESGSAINWDNAFTQNTTVYAHWTETAKGGVNDPSGGGNQGGNGNTAPTGVYTITFDAGDGSVTPESATTTGGKLASLPTPTAPANMTFDKWYTHEGGAGEIVDENYTFTDNATVYAYYTSTSGGNQGGNQGGNTPSLKKAQISHGSTKADLTVSEKGADDTWNAQYTITLPLTAGETVSFEIENTAVEMWIDGRGDRVDNTRVAVTPFKARASSFTVDKAGSYEFYLKDYGEYDPSTMSGGYSLWIEGPTADSGNQGGGQTQSTAKVVIGQNEIGLSKNNEFNEEGFSAEYNNTTAVKINADVELGFKLNNESITISKITEQSNGVVTLDTATGKVKTAINGNYKFYLKVKTDGTYELHVGASEIVDPSTVTVAMTVGTQTTAMTQNTGANSDNLDIEYWLGSGKKVALAVDTVVSFKLNNEALELANVTGYGVEKVMNEDKITGFKVTVAGDCEIYLDRWADTGHWTVSVVNSSKPENDVKVSVERGDQDDNGHKNVYLIVGNESGVDKTQGYFAVFTEEKDGFVQYAVTVNLKAGDCVAIYVPDWNFVCATLQSDLVAPGLQIVTIGTEKYIKITEDKEYTFYFKNQNNNDRIWVAW